MAEFITRAAIVAARWHTNQRRKGAEAEPYVNHLAEVAHLIAAAEPDNIDLICAAYLHDAIEDQKKTREEIKRLFNTNVADIVVEVTDDKTIAKDERKRLQVVNTPEKSRDAKLLKLADKTSNLRALVDSPPADWSIERRRGYIDWACAVVNPACLGISEYLDDQFQEARIEAYASLDGAATKEQLTDDGNVEMIYRRGIFDFSFRRFEEIARQIVY